MNEPIFLPHDAIRLILQTSNIAGFNWTDGPWYKEVPVKWNNSFPLCVYDVDESTVSPTFMPQYSEEYSVSVQIAALQKDIARLSSPYSPKTPDGRHQSPIAYLDGLQGSPQTNLSGSNFYTFQFIRTSFLLDVDDTRGPDTNRVWIATAKYTLSVSADHGTL